MDAAIDLSVIIPTFNQWRLLRRCLTTVLAGLPPAGEVIVVDDGSTDGSAERVAKEFPQARVVRLAANRGFCRAANAGLEVARGRIVELLNNDTEVSPDWHAAPCRSFADPTVGAVAPLVLRLPHRRTIDSAGDTYHPIGVAKKRGEGKTAGAPYDEPKQVSGASASSAFYRRMALREVGGFPEHYGAYLDDVDVALRLGLAGYVCRFEPASRVYHWVSQTHRIRSRRIQSQVARNSERLFWTNLPRHRLAWLAGPHVAFLLVQLAYKGFRGDFGAWFAGKLALLAELPDLLRRRRAAQALVGRARCGR